MGGSEKPICSVPLFARLAVIRWGASWQAIPSLQFAVARFDNAGETKADFGKKPSFVVAANEPFKRRPHPERGRTNAQVRRRAIVSQLTMPSRG